MAAPQLPSSRLMSAVWSHALAAAGLALDVAPDVEAVARHCQDVIRQLPDGQQRQVIARLGAGYIRGTPDRQQLHNFVTERNGRWTSPGIDGPATPSSPGATTVELPRIRTSPERVATTGDPGESPKP